MDLMFLAGSLIKKIKKDNKFALDHNKRIGLGLNYNKILNNLKKKI